MPKSDRTAQRKPNAWASGLLFLVLFAALENLLYTRLLAAAARIESISFTSAEPHGILLHRLLAAGAFGFFGFAVGIGLHACKRVPLTVEATHRAQAWLAIVAIAASAFWFVVVRAQVSAYTDLVGTSGISVSLPIADVPIHNIGIFGGLCVFVYVAGLSMRRTARENG